MGELWVLWVCVFLYKVEEGIGDVERYSGRGDLYKRQVFTRKKRSFRGVKK